MAGLFDGEGNVEITNKFALRCGVSNTFKPVLEMLKMQYGGSLKITKPGKRKRPHWKVGYIWRACGTNALKFLRDIFPFLIIKQPQVKLGLKVNVHVRGVRFTAMEQDERLLWRKEMQRLNKRGLSWENKENNDQN